MSQPKIPPFHVIIPARYGSSRFPGKPLAKIAGREMVLRVVDRALKSGAASVTVATDDERICDVVRSESRQQVHAIETRSDHPSGSDRVMEAAISLGLEAQALVINVQGDEPLIPPAAILQVASLLAQDSQLGAATLSEPILDSTQLFDSNVVKVVSDITGRALYFSRAPIPFDRQHFASEPSSQSTIPVDALNSGRWQRHIGIYGYRLSTLAEFVALPVATLEASESLEQLRLLANGIPLRVEPSCVPMPNGVDTPDDLRRIEQLLAQRSR